jgi:hypothetical protein
VQTKLRNELIHLAMGIGPLRDVMASQAEEVKIGYRDSPIVSGGPAHHGLAHHDLTHHDIVAAGDHAPFITDPSVRGQIGAATAGTGHVVVSIAPDRVPAAPAGHPDGTAQLLVTASPGPVPGYDAVIADPAGSVAGRYGLKQGGRVAIRPDGYVGLIASLDDDCLDYFARLAR